jgi:endonuclease I
MIVRITHIFFALFLLLPVAVLGQGTYYNSLDTGSVSFVTSLHNLINPHTKVTYGLFDETNVVFVSRDTLTNKRVVTCVYSGENYVYTPPFAWTTFSREHTYCHSWMPTNPADSPERPEYCDQHHLFPTNQNNANGVRSNHPLGIVSNATSTYLQGKYGTNTLGQSVYEPRNSHKGDAARALLYMAVCYNGVDGHDWSFNHLNTVILPPQSEAPQSVDLLIQWHNQDPPDQWEKDRNDYIYSIQGNRNPFIDHPEYVAKIDFNTLTKKVWGTVSLATEPANYPTGFAQGTVTTSSVQVTWTKSAAGAQKPSGYLLLASTSASITNPTDGTVISDDTNLSDNNAGVNIDTSLSTYTFNSLPSATTYYFKLIPYNGTSSSRNYKTDGTIPNCSAATASVVLASEPTNYQRGFGYFDPTITDTSITVKWQDTTGAVLPSGYILFSNTSGTFSDPVDGTVYSDDTNLADGTAAVNIAYADADTFRFGGLTSATSYYFKIFPYNGTGSSRNYKTANFPSFTSYIMYTTSGSGTPLTSVVVNEYLNGVSQSTEWVELLVQHSNLDMRGMKLRDYSNSGSIGAGIVFSNDALWSSVPKGAYIVVVAATNTQSQDLSFSGDKKVIVSATNAVYFSGTSFNIGATNDALEMLTSGGTHIHSLSHGSKAGNIATLGSPTANASGSSTSENVVRFINVSTGAHFGEDAHTQHSISATQGLPNDASQTTYMTSVLPVELISFTGHVKNGTILLNWKTATEVNNHGFEVERKKVSGFTSHVSGESSSSVKPETSNEQWHRIAFVDGAGTSSIAHEYSYTDRSLSVGTYSFRLKQIDRDGRFEYSSEVTVTMKNVPSLYSLEQNYPNPFNPSTTIRFTLAATEHVVLTVHNSLGQSVAIAVDGEMTAGSHEIQYDASALSSGTYFYRLTAGKYTATKSFVLMR